jgi:hypothetical protein
MNHVNKLSYLLLIAACWGCAGNQGIEKHQGKRNTMVNVREKVKEIKINEDDALIGNDAGLCLIDNYLIIEDSRSYDKLIHLFDKNQFTYLASTGPRGQGPDEITNMGYIGTNEADRIFYVNDHGKQKIFAYSLDSVLSNPNYVPTIKMNMNAGLFPDKYRYINDTLSIGIVIEPIGNNDFQPSVAKWNMNTGEIKRMPYKHPDVKKKRFSFDVSTENAIYVECHAIHDLMTICSLNGDLKYNIYGPDWSNQWNKIHFYDKVLFCNNRIVAAYSGGNWHTNEYAPTKFLVFDLTGNYLKTLETGYMICDFCYDKDKNRLIMSLDDVEMQFAYLELGGLID